jgi:uncharacterized membrane protein
MSELTPTPGDAIAALPHNTAMVQLYRGELSRLTTYRVRLDTTTNWALGTSMAVVSFTLGHAEAPHAILLLPYLLSLVFLYVESRRYQEFALSQYRIRLLETGYFSIHLGHPTPGGWQPALVESLQSPEFPVTFLQALSARTRRNYVWLFLTIYGAWLVKLRLVSEDMLSAAGLGGSSGAAMISLATAMTLVWVLCAIMPNRVDPVRS